MQCISSTTVGKKIRRQIFYSPCRRWDIRSPPVCMSFPITFLTASSPTSGTSCRRRLMMQSLPLTFSRLFPIWRNPFTYHISAGFLTVLTIRFILTVSATPVTIFFCLTGICASQPSGAVPDTHSIFRLPSTQHGLRNSLASSEGGLLRPDTYMHDISFVGSLYESSHYSSFRYAPNHLARLSAGIIAAQKEVWGIDLISPVLTPGRLAEFTAFMPYSEAGI